jgi:ABC-type multidrug transport system fused ATPase/permease subunit
MALPAAASPRSLIRYSLLGILSATMPPIAVYLGAALVNRIADARLHALQFSEMLPILIGLWLAATVQRAVGAYTGYGRNLFVRRVQLEAERRLLEQAAKVDIGHFDNSDWYDRLARAKRDVSWRPGDLTWSVLGLSGNIVTIVLMATLLASLHYVLVILALAAAVLSLALERRVTSQMYEFFYKETPEEREREYLGDLLAQPRTTKELRAYVRRTTCSADMAGSRRICSSSGSAWRTGTRTSVLTGSSRHDPRARVRLRRDQRGLGRDRSRRRRPGDRRVHVGCGNPGEYFEHVRGGRSAHHVPRRLFFFSGD